MTYDAIIREFRKEGLSEQEVVTEHQLKKALDNISSRNAGISQFDNDVAHQIWNQTRDNLVGAPVKLKDFVVTMVKAQSILKQQVEYTQNLIKVEADPRKKQQLLNDLFSYSQDHRTITIPFGLQQIRQSKQIQESRMHNTIRQAKSLYFSTSLDERQQSTDLKLVFAFTVCLLLIDLFVMFQKNNFYNLMGVSLIICCFVLNYFEKIYVRFVLGWTLVSILLDLIWLILKTHNFWNVSGNDVHSTKQIGLLRFIIFMVCFEMIIKIIQLALLFKYRNAVETLRKKVNICGLTFLLDSQPDHSNLIAKLFNEKPNPSNNFFEPV